MVRATQSTLPLVTVGMHYLNFADLSLHFLAKMKILVVRDVERDDIEFVSKTLGCMPVAHVDSFTADKLGSAELVEEVSVGAGTKVTKITGVKNPGTTISILARGSNKLVLDETDRSIHDALCVVRSLVKKKFLIAGGFSRGCRLNTHATYLVHT